MVSMATIILFFFKIFIAPLDIDRLPTGPYWYLVQLPIFICPDEFYPLFLR